MTPFISISSGDVVSFWQISGWYRLQHTATLDNWWPLHQETEILLKRLEANKKENKTHIHNDKVSHARDILHIYKHHSLITQYNLLTKIVQSDSAHIFNMSLSAHANSTRR